MSQGERPFPWSKTQELHDVISERLGFVRKEVLELKAGKGRAKALVNVVQKLVRVVSRYAELVIEFRVQRDVSPTDELRQNLAKRGFYVFHIGKVASASGFGNVCIDNAVMTRLRAVPGRF